MKDRKLKITRKEDDYSIFSIRIKNDTMKKLDEIATKTNRSRNEVINICLEFALNNLEDDTIK
ncbi:MAG TPA: ribbon-helix-helix protein, CopG family [Pseudobacteroides sp.]|nr:ribbon-helix-helix protein, CopG family [Pseudobacteroides sp.]